MAERKNWTREELIVAFNLYCKIPFSKINYNHKLIIELADAIGRTPSAVAWKLVNFASLDPTLKAKNIKGASNSGKLDKVIFDEFYSDWNNLAYESELDRSFISMIERGLRMPTIDTLFKIAKPLRKTPSEILGAVETRYKFQG